MVSGQRIVGVHTTSGMVLPAPQHRCVKWRILLLILFGFFQSLHHIKHVISRQYIHLNCFYLIVTDMCVKLENKLNVLFCSVLFS